MEELKNLWLVAKEFRGSCGKLSKEQVDVIYKMCNLYNSFIPLSQQIKYSQCASLVIIDRVHKFLNGHGLI